MLRTRIVLWYGVVITVCLLTFSVTVGVSFTAHVGRDLDRRVHEDIELGARALVIDAEGNPAWVGGFVGKQIEEEEGGGHFLEVWDEAGKRRLVAGTFDPGPLEPPEARMDGVGRTYDTAAGRVRTMWEDVEIDGRSLRLRAIVSERSARAQVRSLWSQLALISLVVLVLGGLGGVALAHRLTAPLARMAEHARRITAERLDERLDARGAGQELEQLGAAFNATLSHLEESFDQLKRFTADASHEIRTPLTAIRTVGEVALQGQRSTEEYREVIGAMLEETDRLGRLVENLLTLARAEAGRAHYHFENLDVRILVDEVVEQLSVLAEERGQVIRVEGESRMAPVDRLSIRHALVNVIDNAIAYSPENEEITVRIGGDTTGVEISVEDRGPGIPREHLPRLFERFYRVDPGRSRDKGGTGLGLSLVRLAVEAHGGRVDVDSTEGMGSTFRMRLPVSPSASR